jgi:predicted phosphohydrolase
MATFQYCSDLHLEFSENRQHLVNNPLKPKAPVLILAGDIVSLNSLNKADEFLNFVSGEFEQVYWVPGNHEYYRSDVSLYLSPLNEKIRPNVSLVNNAVLTIAGVRIIFSTLWAHIPLSHEKSIRRGINDFALIKINGSNLTVEDFNRMHADGVEFISNSLTNHIVPSIVVTHHVPTLQKYPTHFLTSPLNSAFATELDDLIMNHQPAFWIFGHHHQNISPFKIGKTILLTNQLGYVTREEHVGFRQDQTLKID